VTDIVELAYKEAAVALSTQQEAVDSVRDRAGVVVAAATAATGFFASGVVAEGEASGWALLAMVAFFVAGIPAVSVLLPFLEGGGYVRVARQRWQFRYPLSDLREEVSRKSESELLQAATEELEKLYYSNQDRMKKLVSWTRLAAVIYAVEVGFWFASIRQGG